MAIVSENIIHEEITVRTVWLWETLATIQFRIILLPYVKIQVKVKLSMFLA